MGWLREEPDKVNECAAVIRQAEAGKLKIVTSALTLTEVLWLKGKQPIPQADRERVRKFFANEYIVLYELDRATAEAAQDVLWEHGVRPKDSVHVATALSASESLTIEQLDTFDGGLIGMTGKIGHPPLVIGRPNLDEGKLFA